MHAGLLALLVLAAAPAGRAPLRLQLDNCTEIDEATVRRVVGTELQAALSDEHGSGVLTTALATCTDGQVGLAIDDPVTGKSTTRTLDLADQPRRLRSRLLGLAIAEAVLASWIELQLTRASSEASPVAPPPLESRRQESRREAADIAQRRLQVRPRPLSLARYELLAGPTARWFSSGLGSWGLAVGARRWLDREPAAGLGLDLDGTYGQRTTERAHGDAAALALAGRLLMRSDFGPLAVAASAGWRVGLARLSAQPANELRSGRAALRAFTGPCFAVDLSIGLSRALDVRASLETGYAVVSARGGVDSVPVVALEGSWLSAVLAVGTKL